MDLRPFRHRDYRFLFTAQAVSFLGSLLTYVALPYQVYRLTGSSLAVGLVGLAELGPLLLTAFVGGALADAVDRRKMVLWTEAALAGGSFALAANAMLPAPLVWPLYVAAAIMSALNGLQRPSLDSLMPRLVDKDEVPAAVALSMFRGGIGMIAGPALGGVLIASSGVDVAYLADFVSYILSFLAVRMIRHLPPAEGAASPSFAGILDGFRYARSRQELIGSYVVDFVAMVFGMPMALFPAVADTMGGPKSLGLLYAAPAVGGLVASVTSRWTPRVRRHGLAIAVAAVVWGAAIVVFGYCERLWPAVFFLAIAGGADAISGLFRMTLWNQTIPDALRGRLASIEIVSYTSGPLLGHAEAGLAAALGGVRFSVVSGGALCVVGVAVCAALLPGFVRYEAPPTPAPADPAVALSPP